MTKTELAQKITNYVYTYIVEAECSCSYDPYVTCWYHMNPKERIEMLAKTVERMIDDFSS